MLLSFMIASLQMNSSRMKRSGFVLKVERMLHRVVSSNWISQVTGRLTAAIWDHAVLLPPGSGDIPTFTRAN